MNLLLTGSSGYLGTLLIDSWINDPNIEKIIAIDIRPPRFLDHTEHPKVQFIAGNVADLDFKKVLSSYPLIDAIVHTAYFIKTPYFKSAIRFQDHSNFFGLENLLKFSIENKIPQFIHFGTVASYGAKPDNTIHNRFLESTVLREDQIKYGQDKKIIEEKISELLNSSAPSATKVTIFRIGSVSGPFLQNVVKKTGLMSFFRGSFPVIPVVSVQSARQYIHEEDVVGAVNFILEKKPADSLTIFNLAARDVFTFKDIAELLGKRVIKIPFALANLAFNLLWHLSLGKIPTPPKVINSYSYPIIVDGNKLSSFGYEYRYNGKEALLGSAGKFSKL